MFSALLTSLRFLWSASAGSRLRPWRSLYLRWRLETYTGKPAGTLVLGDFTALAWRERRQMLHFFRWMGQMERLARPSARDKG